jgi:hypothetical protein
MRGGPVVSLLTRLSRVRQGIARAAVRQSFGGGEMGPVTSDRGVAPVYEVVPTGHEGRFVR